MKIGDEYMAKLSAEEIKERLTYSSNWLNTIIEELQRARTKSLQLQMTERGRFIDDKLSRSIDELQELRDLLQDYPIQEKRAFGEVIPYAK